MAFEQKETLGTACQSERSDVVHDFRQAKAGGCSSQPMSPSTHCGGPLLFHLIAQGDPCEPRRRVGTIIASCAVRA